MEDLFLLILEVVIELIVQWPVDAALSRREKRAQEQDRRLRYGLALGAAILLGAAAGWLSDLFFPVLWPASAAGRAFMIVGAPLLLGFVSYAINQAKERRGSDWLEPRRHATCAALFALAWAITRTVLAASAE
jgi:hypothetical protein